MARSGDGRHSKSLCAAQPILTPERRLWRAVLQQAYDDAELTVLSETGIALPETPERVWGQRFLRADGPDEAADLQLVCDFAEVPADRVISWARRTYLREQSEPPAAQEQLCSCASQPSSSSSDPEMVRAGNT
jgi:hypothetical protein